MEKYYFRINVREDRLQQVSYARTNSKKRFPLKQLLILLAIVLIGFLLFSCSSKEVKPTCSEVPVEHSKHMYVRYNDGRIEYLGPVESIPYLVDIEHDKRLSYEENLEIIKANGNRVRKNNQDALLDFQFEGFDRIINHRDYVGIFTGSSVFVPVYKEYQSSYFSYGLIIFGFIFFTSFFSATYLGDRKFKLLIPNEGESHGSMNLLLGQIFLAGVLLLFLFTIIFAFTLGMSNEFANIVALIFLYSLGTIGPIGILLWFGSNVHPSGRVIVSLIILGIINFLLWCFAGVTEYIFYVTFIPAFIGFILGIILLLIKYKKMKKEDKRKFEQSLMM